jgi:hypothetical protein
VFPEPAQPLLAECCFFKGVTRILRALFKPIKLSYQVVLSSCPKNLKAILLTPKMSMIRPALACRTQIQA